MTYGPVAPPVSGGVYQVSLPEHVLWMMVSMAVGGPAPNTSSDYKLVGDIDMGYDGGPTAPDKLQSICRNATVNGPFIGTFDGLKSPPPTDSDESPNYQITIPLSLVNVSTNDFFGLFGFVGDGATADKGVSNVDVLYTGTAFTYTTTANPSYMGSLVGLSDKASITGCNVTYSNDVVITHKNNTGAMYTGGLCGTIRAQSVLTDCKLTFLGTVELLSDNNASASGSTERVVGGICGYMGISGTRVLNTFQRCNVYLSKNTLFGSKTINATTSVRNIGGICAGAFGDVIFDNCNILQTDGATGGTFIFQNSGSSTLVNSADVVVGGIIGLFEQNALFSANRETKKCSFVLNSFDISFNINLVTTTSTISGFIARLDNSGISTADRAVFNINNITGTAKSISIATNTTVGTSSTYFTSAMFARLGVNNIMVNIYDCTLTILQGYTVNLTSSGGTGIPIYYYGAVVGLLVQGTIANSIVDLSSESYRIVRDCTVNVGGSTSITITQTVATLTSPSQGAVGGLFGRLTAGIKSGTAYALIIRNCDSNFSGNFSLVYTSNVTTDNTGTLNPYGCGGFIGEAFGCNISDCDCIFGSSNNTILISVNTKNPFSTTFVSCGVGRLEPQQSVTLGPSAFALLSNCTFTVNGNLQMTNITDIASLGTSTTNRETRTGGLVGRINDGSTCENSRLSINGAYTILSKNSTKAASPGGRCIIGGLVGDIDGTTTTIVSILNSSRANIQGNFTINGNIDNNLETWIGGMVGNVVNTSNFTNCRLTCDGSTTLTSTTPLVGGRSIGGMIGWSGEGTANNTVKNVTSNTVTYNGPFLITVASIANDFGGGLFGRIQDGTLVSDCYGEFNSTLTINNQGITSGSKAVGGICGSLAIAKAAAPFLVGEIRTSRILVQSTAIFSIVTNEPNGNSRCSAMFGIVQDTTLSPGGDSSAASCTATFNGTVSVVINNTAPGGLSNTVYLGGVVADNLRSGIEGNILNLTNGIIIDNQSITNSNCFAGIICGRTTSNLLGNIATTNNNIVNISGTAIIDTNSNSNTAAAGTLAGQVDSDFKDNTVSGQNATFIINATSEQDGTWAGGLTGQVTNSQASQLVTVSGNSLFAGHLTITTNSVSTGSSFNGGLVGRINTTNITFSNNIVSVNGGATLRNIAVNSTVYMALLFAGLGQSGVGGPYTLTNNTFVAYQGIQLTTSNSIPTIYIDDKLGNSDEATPSNLVNCNAYVCGIGDNTLLNFTEYPPTDGSGLTIFGVDYPITSTYTSPRGVYYIEVLPAITINIGCIRYEVPEPQTCCTPNICNKNPQVASYSNQTIINRRAGQAMIANMDSKIIAQNNNTGRIYVQPMFSSYQQYMTYLQSKNAR